MSTKQTGALEKEKKTLKARAMATPTMKRKNGITKSARVQPFHGEWSILEYAPPASSTNIINYIKTYHTLLDIYIKKKKNKVTN